MTYDTRGGALGTIGRQALQGATLGFSDEIIDAPTAAIVAALTGQSFSDVYNQARGMTKEDLSRDWENAPGTSFISQAVGSIPFGFTKAAKGLQGWVRGSDAPIKGAKAITKLLGRGTAVGAGYGALSGFGGTTPEPNQKLADAILGRLGGSSGGAVIGGILGGAGAPLSRLGSPTSNVDYRKVTKEVAKGYSNRAEKLLAEQLAARPDLANQLSRAEAMNTASQNTGIDLTLAEKISQSQSDPLLAQQKILGGNPMTSGAMEGMYAARSGTNNQTGQIENALLSKARELAPNVGSYDEAANGLINQAGEIEGNITKGLVSEARPYYQAAEPISLQREVSQSLPMQDSFGGNVNSTQNVITRDPILDNPVVKKAVSSVMSNPAYQQEIAGNFKPTSIKVLDLAQRSIRDQADAAERGGERNLARLYRSAHSKLVQSLKDASPDYATATEIYSGQPDKLMMRERMGSLADIDPMQAKKVAQSLFSGTQQNAEMASQALGPEGSKMAAASRIYDAMDTARGDPTSLAGKIAPDARTMDMFRTYAGGNQLDETLNVINQAKIGEKFRYGSPTNQLGQAEKTLADAAGSAADLAVGGKMSMVKKVLGMFGKTAEEDPQFYKDMMNLMTTDSGMELVRKVAQGQGTAVQKQLSGSPLMQSLQGPRTAIGMGVQSGIIGGVAAPSQDQLRTNATSNQYMQELPPGFQIYHDLPPGFVLQ